MTTSEKEKTPAAKRRWKTPVFASLGTLVLLIAIVALSVLWMQQRYAQAFYPGVRIGQVSVSGQSYLEVLTRLEEYVETVEAEGITFAYQDTSVTVTPTALATSDPDLAVSLYSFSVEPSVTEAFAIGRDGTYWQNTMTQLQTLFSGREVSLRYEVAEEPLIDLLQESFQEHELAAQDAQLSVADDGKLMVTEEADGMTLDYTAALTQVHQAFVRQLSDIQISLQAKTVAPALTRSSLTLLVPEAEAVLARAPFVLQMSEGEEEIPAEQLAPWLIAQPATVGAVLGVSAERADEYFSELSEEVEVAPQEGRFAIAEGKVTALQAGKDGVRIDRTATAAAMTEQWIQAEKNEAPLITAITHPEISSDDASPLQGLSLLGTGHSNFAGSPNNRRHNIRVGAESVHGLVVRPGEEFSLVNTLGPIEKETGYLPELVIKGDKTIPEYGGGLCQIGTTVFRAAMAAAMPVTERRNHSYSVSYYLENGLPGTDATIYPPHPDFRFLNDTEGPILIQSRIEGNDVYFDFWGKPDGRTASRTTPRVWGWTNPPPTREVVSNDLAPGQRKCTERAHKGVKAEFTYTITYGDGRVEEKVFQSTYKPWQEVCLVGPSA